MGAAVYFTSITLQLKQGRGNIGVAIAPEMSSEEGRAIAQAPISSMRFCQTALVSKVSWLLPKISVVPNISSFFNELVRSSRSPRPEGIRMKRYGT